MSARPPPPAGPSDQGWNQDAIAHHLNRAPTDHPRPLPTSVRGAGAPTEARPSWGADGRERRSPPATTPAAAGRRGPGPPDEPAGKHPHPRPLPSEDGGGGGGRPASRRGRRPCRRPRRCTSPLPCPAASACAPCARRRHGPPGPPASKRGRAGGRAPQPADPPERRVPKRALRLMRRAARPARPAPRLCTPAATARRDQTRDQIRAALRDSMPGNWRPHG